MVLTNAQGAPQELTSALSGYQDTTLFQGLLQSYPQALQNLVGDDSDVTVLVPSDSAVTKYLESTNSSATDLDPDSLEVFFAYHILGKSLTGAQLQSEGPQGLVVPTKLTGEQYNNRSAGPALSQIYGEDAGGQVIVAKPPSGNSARRFKRQSGGDDIVSLRVGLGQDAQLQAVDGQWGPNNASSFQIVDR